MGIKTAWDNPEQTILRIEFEDRWQWAEFDAAWETVLAAVAGRPQHLDFIFDVTRSTLMPPDLGYRLRQGQYMIGRKDSLRIVVGADRFVKILIEFIARMFNNQRLHFVETLEEAHMLIAQHRSATH